MNKLAIPFQMKRGISNVLLTGILVIGSTVLTMAALTGCSSHENGGNENSNNNTSLTPTINETEATVEGVPGGVTQRTATLTATVANIDYEKRTVTLEDKVGGRKTLTIGPEAVNFNQVEKGDQVKIAYLEEIIVYMKDQGAPMNDGVAIGAAAAEEGEKPQGIMAGSLEMTGTVTSIDTENRTATLEFTDGSSQVFPVRDDITLDDSQIGREVVIHMTTAIAMSVDRL